MESDHPARFGGHRDCSSEEIAVLVCHVILQDPVTTDLSNFRGGNRSS